MSKDYEMIFRVSQAIRATPNSSDYAELVAVNAIKAMREPTDGMIAAGAKIDDCAEGVWQDMIDAITGAE